MRVFAKQIVVWLILLTVPLQGVATVTSALQGPAHYHHDVQPVIQPKAHHAHAFHHGDHSHHGQDQVRRHYHLPGDRAVAVHDDQHDITAVQERSSKGESVSAAFIGLIPQSPSFHVPDLASIIKIGSAAKFLSITLSRIERPPRLLPA